MDTTKLTLPRAVQRVVVLGGSANAASPVVYAGTTRKKKSSKLLKPIERGIRKLCSLELVAAQTYLNRHNASNQVKQDGWKKDFGKNIKRSIKAARRAAEDQD
jgi:hypothetical protein